MTKNPEHEGVVDKYPVDGEILFQPMNTKQKIHNKQETKKWVKKFNGMGDPYNHLDSFQQMARAKKVYDLHILVEGFGLTMEGKALTQSQALKIAKYYSFMKLAKKFVIEHKKIGLKNDVLSQLYQFTQGYDTIVRDCANQLRKYLTRCPLIETLSQEQLVSLFLACDLSNLNKKT